MSLRFRIVVPLALAVLAWSTTAGTPAEPEIRFNRDVRPILSDNCFACHGPDENTRKAKLRLDTEDGLFSKRDDYQIVTPGNRRESELFHRITTQNTEDRMPPEKSGKTLSAEHIELIGRWIDRGARWEGHWAFIKPERPRRPVVKDARWPRNEIDYFILHNLESAGLKPSPQATREQLIRRLSYDLTGLPPTIAELNAFLNDTTPTAYEQLVERFLAKPQYGERMAVHWLDIARYADTHGYHLDSGRDMWKWREWVIDAFNNNQPFDQFTVEQIAGDLLPNATTAQKLATGFNRNSMINFEGGAIPEEYLTQYIIDRVTTTSTVFLGLTVGCAQCHDHKFDPVSQKDFYRLYAYFNAVPENGLDGRNGNAAPLIYLPDSKQQTVLDEFKRAIAAAEQKLAEALPAIDAAQPAWEQELKARLQAPWIPLTPAEWTSRNTAALDLMDDGSILATGKNPEHDTFEVVARIEETGITALRLEALLDDSLTGRGPGRADNGNFILSEFEVEAAPMNNLSQRQTIQFASAHADYSQSQYEIEKAIDGNPQTGWAVDGNSRHQPATAWFVATTPFGHGAGTELRIRLRFESQARHSIGRFRLAASIDPAAAGPVPPPRIAEIVLLNPDKRSETQKGSLQTYYRETGSSLFRIHSAELARRRKALADFHKTIPTSMVMEQMDQPRDTFVLIRGQYNQHGEKVDPGVPASLHPLPENAPADRRALAQWLVDPNNPLTARVTVNRFWALVMGNGLVRTANDFGTQAEWPSHPELLDWLATEFVASGWDVKHLMRLIVNSATYRQSSVLSPELAEKDPENRLYARGPRFRLSAEAIRDTALAVGGLLVPEIGGPSVSPYQPPGLWEELSMRKDSGNWSAQKYVQDHGEKLYRRGMYTFWKRTSPPPSLQAFDAPNRETCVVQRDRTTTPLQALVLMNDPTYVEAARFLAERIIAEGGASAAERITYAFRLTLSRQPSTAEITILTELLEQERARFAANQEQAEQLLNVGEGKRNPALDPIEHAAWTTIATTILNLDETITKS